MHRILSKKTRLVYGARTHTLRRNESIHNTTFDFVQERVLKNTHIISIFTNQYCTVMEEKHIDNQDERNIETQKEDMTNDTPQNNIDMVMKPTTAAMEPTNVDSIHYHTSVNDKGDSLIDIVSIQSIDSNEKEHATQEEQQQQQQQEESIHHSSTLNQTLNEIAPPYDNDDSIKDESIEQITSQDINTVQSCDSATNANIQSGTKGVGIMNDKMSELMRSWSHDEHDLVSKDSTTNDMKIPKFQPGDHVIRWKVRTWIYIYTKYLLKK